MTLPGDDLARRLVPDTGGSPGVDRLAGLAAQLLDAPTSVVSLHGRDAEVASGSMAGTVAGKEAGTVAGTWAGTLAGTVVGTSGITSDEAPTELCALVATDGRTLSIADTRIDPRAVGFRDLIGSYLGVPMRSADGEVVGALCVFDRAPRSWSQNDVRILEQLASAAETELELAALTREYELDRARWDGAIAAAGIGNFDWDLATGRLQWDQPLIELFGYDGDERFDESIEAFNARVHPDDVPDVSLRLQRAIDTLGPYEAEYRIVLPGNRIRRIQARGHAIGSGATAERVAGSAWDVSATRGAEERAANILEAMPVGYVSLDAGLAVTAMNTVAERLLHTDRLTATGRTLADIAPSAAASALADDCRAVRDSQYSIEVELYFAAPVASWLEVRIWPEANGTALYLTDVTERREAEELTEQLAEYDRTTARALQEAMLSELPQPSPLQIGARYRPAAARNRVGGDWYDAVVQSGGSTVVMVGDVTGHDIRAAAVMGQLRSMLRVLAWQGEDGPRAVLDRLDRAIAALHSGVLGSAVVARVEETPDRSVRTLRWCSAGHPPPILVRADGTSEVLACDGIMLGVRPGESRTEFTTDLPAGATVLLYTDGLIERRGAVLDVGLDRLRAAASRHCALGTEEFLDAVLADVVDVDETDDDVVLLALQVGDQGARPAG